MKNAPSPDAVSRVVRWALLLFFAYAILSGGLHILPPPGPAPAHMPQTTAQKASDCDNTKAPLEQFSSIASVVLPSFVPIIHSQDVKPGAGVPAVCGQLATVRYEYSIENGPVIFSNIDKDEPSQVLIGGGNLLRGMETSLIDMQQGGERLLAFPSVLGFGHVRDIKALSDSRKFDVSNKNLSSAIITGRVSLLSLSPDVPVSTQKLRIIDHQLNNGTRVLCGNTVQVYITVWKLDGTPVFNATDINKPLVFTLGRSQVPYGIEQGMLGMSEDSERTIILPAASTKPLISGAAHYMLGDTSLPEETLLAEVHVAHVSDDAAPADIASFKPTISPATTTPPAPTAPAAQSGAKPVAPAEEEDKDDDTKENTDTTKPTH